jgi:hypothetical protein
MISRSDRFTWFLETERTRASGRLVAGAVRGSGRPGHAEEGEEAALAARERPRTSVHECVHAIDVIVEHAALLVGLDHSREDVRRATDSGGVAEMFRDLADGGRDAPLRLGPGPRLARRVSRERAGAEERSRPGPEVLRAEPLPHHVLDVRIDVLPPHIDHGAGIPLELEHLAGMTE